MTCAALLLTLSAHAGEGVLASVGERLGDGEVVGVQTHPEYERLQVRLPDGRVLAVEAVAARPDRTGACEAHGVVLFPRWELLGETVDIESQPHTVTALCERLDERGAGLSLATTAPAAVSDPVAEMRLVVPEWHPHWLHGVLLALLAAVGACFGVVRRAWRGLEETARWDFAGVTATAVIARLALSRRGLLIGPDAGWERVVMSWGGSDDHPLYGAGFGVLMGPVARLAHLHPAALWWSDLVLAMAAPPLLWTIARLLMPGRLAALVAGLGLALLPAHLLLSGSEVEQVSVLTLELLAATAALGFSASGSAALAVVAALAGGFVVHLRPEALPFLLLVPWLAGRWRSAGFWLAGALLAGVASLRVLSLLGGGVVSGAVEAGDLLDPGVLFNALLPRWTARSGTQLFLHLRETPVLLPLLALVGLARVTGRTRRVVIAWWACTLLPVLPKTWPLIDELRLQLPVQAPLLLLAGGGAAALVRVPRPRLAVALLAASFLPWLPQVLRVPAIGAESRLLCDALPHLGADHTVFYDDSTAHADKLALVMSTLTEARVRPLSEMGPDEAEHSARFVWVGTSCRGPGASPDCPRPTSPSLLPDAAWSRPVEAREDLDLFKGQHRFGLTDVRIGTPLDGVGN